MEIMINQDIRKFKTKDVGNFTFREAGFIVVGAALGYGMYFLEKKYFGEAQIESCLLPMIIVLAFGFAKPFGLTMKQFMDYAFPELFLRKKYLPYESDFVVDLADIEEVYGEEYGYPPERIKEFVQMSGDVELLGKAHRAGYFTDKEFAVLTKRFTKMSKKKHKGLF